MIINDVCGNGGYEDVSMDDTKYDGLDEYLEERYCPSCKSKDINYIKEKGIVCEECGKIHDLDTFDKFHKKCNWCNRLINGDYENGAEKEVYYHLECYKKATMEGYDNYY